LVALTYETGMAIAPPDSGKIQKSLGKTARCIWLICLTRIIATFLLKIEFWWLRNSGKSKILPPLNQKSPYA